LIIQPTSLNYIYYIYSLRKIMSVVVKIQDPTGTEIGSFEAEDEKNLCEMAAMHGIEILKSCGA
jgi:hypothetical protein